jgi:DNA-binding response OmpR family regulator
MPTNELKFPDYARLFSPASEKPVVLPLPDSHGEKPRVLVADADPVAKIFFFQYLAQAGFDVVMADNGDEAIAELRRADHPAIAILDVTMPGMSRAEICRRMRSVDKLVYVILTGEHVGKIDVLQAGADLCLRKPIVELNLLASVRAGLNALEQRRAPVDVAGEERPDKSIGAAV